MGKVPLSLAGGNATGIRSVRPGKAVPPHGKVIPWVNKVEIKEEGWPESPRPLTSIAAARAA